MPIYAYKCSACGHTQDVLQKMSDDKLTVCTACAKESFEKQLTAPGFQLKGSGWYVTDFRDTKKPDAAKADAPAKTDAAAPAAAPAAGESAKTEAAPASPAPAATPAPAAAPAASSAAS